MNYRVYELLGAHPDKRNEEEGYVFRTWAPNAKAIYLVGDFNDWNVNLPMQKIKAQDCWEIFVPGMKEFTSYKYILEDVTGKRIYKADPYGFHAETRPDTASKTFNLDKYKWKDKKWQNRKQKVNLYESPMNIYEVHFGSWKKYEDGNFFDYHKMTQELIPYVKGMGYTHIELMPMSEYPYDGSWGYQIIGYYAATSRYGTPDGFMAFIDACHNAGLGVILDWVPGHFPKDEAGLYQFDGGTCYEYQDNLKNEHKDWGTMVFDWGRDEIRSFLISNAIFWLEKFHIDGLRVDAVASMLYLDYGRDAGQWRANIYGGHENLEAVEFLQELNKTVFSNFPNALMIAEESTAWPMVTKPVDVGGLGFNFKWNMGWMNDTLVYMEQDTFFRGGCHHHLTFAMTYMYSENFILPLSHDEVVHMKGSLIGKMPGEYAAKFANLRTYLAYMIAHPGKKLFFMGTELAQFSEWNYETQLDWNLLDYPMHKKFHKFIKDLNHLYKERPQLWELDDVWEGFQWINSDDSNNNVLSFKRFDKSGHEMMIISNFSAVAYKQYLLGIESKTQYRLLFSTADKRYGGDGLNQNAVTAEDVSYYGKPYSIALDIPELSTSLWVRDEEV